MAVSFLNNRDVSDLCLGKPPLRWVSVGDTVAEALSVVKRSGDSHVSVWSCSADHSSEKSLDDSESLGCICLGKICMVDFVCFLCKEENLGNPFKALEGPVSQILPKGPPFTVKHLEPHCSLLQAMDCILEGAQNLVIPIANYMSRNSRKMFINMPSSFSFTPHNGREYCWITQEDVLRYLLDSIGVFSPIPTHTIGSLNLIDYNIMTVSHEEPASSALPFISRSLVEQTSVAVIDEANRLTGEISPFTLACCHETVAAAITTLSTGDLMTYIDCSDPPEHVVQLVKTRLGEKHLETMLELMDDYSSTSLSSSSSSCSSDDESVSIKSSGLGRYSRGSEAIVCYPWSSLIAVMIQALAHRLTYVWVVEEDYTLVGLVTFEGMVRVFRSNYGLSCHRVEDGPTHHNNPGS